MKLMNPKHPVAPRPDPGEDGSTASRRSLRLVREIHRRILLPRRHENPMPPPSHPTRRRNKNGGGIASVSSIGLEIAVIANPMHARQNAGVTLTGGNDLWRRSGGSCWKGPHSERPPGPRPRRKSALPRQPSYPQSAAQADLGQVRHGRVIVAVVPATRHVGVPRGLDRHSSLGYNVTHE